MNVCECLPKTYRSNKGHFSVCGCLCVCALFSNTLAELLSYPSNICYEFGPCPEQHRHMSESPDSPNNPAVLPLRCRTGGVSNAERGEKNSAADFFFFFFFDADFCKALIAFHPRGLNAGSTFLTSVKRKTSASLSISRLLPKR